MEAPFEFIKGQCEKFKVFRDFHRQKVQQQQTVETTNKENKQEGKRTWVSTTAPERTTAGVLFPSIKLSLSEKDLDRGHAKQSLLEDT